MTGNAPTLGQLKDLLMLFLQGLPANPEYLVGTEWEQHLRNGAMSHQALRAMLGLTPSEALWRLSKDPDRHYMYWQTIKTGTHSSSSRLIADVKLRCKVRFSVLREFNKAIELATEETEIELYWATVAELGFPEGAGYDEIRQRVHELGFADCLSELGFQLRRQYLCQQKREQIVMIMKPVIVRTEGANVLSVFCDSEEEFCLGWEYAGLGSELKPSCACVFVRRQE